MQILWSSICPRLISSSLIKTLNLKMNNHLLFYGISFMPHPRSIPLSPTFKSYNFSSAQMNSYFSRVTDN